MGLKGADVVTAIGGHDVIIKKIEMDRMKEADAREVIRWEAEQHVPFDIKSVELDFQILDPEARGSRCRCSSSPPSASSSTTRSASSRTPA
jgi:type IV pilus assembly protein PilM